MTAKGLKQRDIRPCALCKQGVMHDSNMVFYRLRLEYHVVDVGAVQRAHGAEMMMGSPALAQILGVDEDMSKVVDTGDILVCLPCAMTQMGAVVNASLGDEPETGEQSDG